MSDESKIKKTFAHNLSFYLTKQDKTQKDLAEYLGVSGTTVTNWVRGYKMPRMDKIDKICAFLTIGRNSLLTEHSDSDHFKKGKTPSNPSVSAAALQYDSLLSKFPDLSEAVSLYISLDSIDRGEIRGEMKGMLRSEKYRPKVKNDKAI